jgi:hypothetical protein
VLLGGDRVGAEAVVDSARWVREQAAGVTPAGRYTVGPPVYGDWLCVRCGQAAAARRDFCDGCGAAGVAVARLDRDRDSAEHHAAPAEQWPAAHPDWRGEAPATPGEEPIYTRTAGGLVWRLTAIGKDDGTSWHLRPDGGLKLVSPSYERRSPYLEYPRRSVVLALGNRAAAQALVMADRFIAGYLAAHTEPLVVDGDAEGGA